MTTPPIELAATVERVERKEPPEPEGWIGLAYKSLSEEWQIDRSFLWSNREDAIESLRSTHYKNEHRLVRISPAPSPAEYAELPSEEVRKVILDALQWTEIDEDPSAKDEAISELRRVWGMSE